MRSTTMFPECSRKYSTSSSIVSSHPAGAGVLWNAGPLDLGPGDAAPALNEVQRRLIGDDDAGGLAAHRYVHDLAVSDGGDDRGGDRTHSRIPNVSCIP
jgi:hypothetical protein